MVTRIGPNKPFRHYLKEWRQKVGLTQQQLADRLPVGEDGKPTGKDQISRWERGERDMTMSVQAALAEALGFPDNPGKIFQDPDRPSVDELLRNAAPERRIQIIAVVETMLKTGT
jgi:transcriptional regulator with XRE-family HTH domain